MFTPGMNSDCTWTGGDVHSSNPTTSSSGFDWDITGTLLTDDNDIKLFAYATYNFPMFLLPNALIFPPVISNVLSSMPPFDRAEVHQAIEPLSSHFKSQAPELLRIQTSWTEFDTNSTDIVNKDLVLPSGEGDRFGYRGGDAQMPDRQSSIHASNEDIFNLSKAASLFLDESYGTEETPSNPAHFGIREDTSLSAGPERPLTHIENPRYVFNTTTRSVALNPPSVFAIIRTVALVPLRKRHIRSRIVKRIQKALSLDLLFGIFRRLRFYGILSVSVSSEFSVDILPCPEGFRRAEFEPRHQELWRKN
ncbi:hypothetical protein EV421DRAFT_1741855 [Armillaria borealis]|uniref:Uncharacterized protein n=1 Tax=Armillaria borealis TaxID=47425 RepID=A0AA39IZ07_9AGAR|nr:hypothetical protein EV421DRAFT_1741855 [Armillaria borealis]